MASSSPQQSSINGTAYLLPSNTGAQGLANYPHARTIASSARTIFISGTSSRCVDGTYEGCTETKGSADGTTTFTLDCGSQTAAVLRNIETIIQGVTNGRCGLEAVVDATVFLTDIRGDYAVMNAEWNKVWPDRTKAPARTPRWCDDPAASRIQLHQTTTVLLRNILCSPPVEKENRSTSTLLGFYAWDRNIGLTSPPAAESSRSTTCSLRLSVLDPFKADTAFGSLLNRLLCSTVMVSLHPTDSSRIELADLPGSSCVSQFSTATHPRSEPVPAPSPPQCISAEFHASVKSLDDIQCHIFGCTAISERGRVMNDMGKGGFWDNALEVDAREYPPIPWMDNGLPEKNCCACDQRGAQASPRAPGSWSRTSTKALLTGGFRPNIRLEVGERVAFTPPPPVTTDSEPGSGEKTKAESEDHSFTEALQTIIQEYVVTLGEGEAQDSPSKQPDHTHDVGRPSSTKEKRTKKTRDYDLERDVKLGKIDGRRTGAPRTDATLRSGRYQGVHEKQGRGRWLTHKYEEGYKGQFPDQVISIEKFFGQEFRRDSVVVTPGKDHSQAERLRWFHIPYNNMEWIEKAIRCYFKDGIDDSEARMQAGMVLRKECWKGQEYGSGTETIVHTRHLRSLCDRFSTGRKRSYSDKSRNNMVLFMPYLHWETDRNWARMVEVVQKKLDEHAREHSDGLLKERKENQTARKGLTGPHGTCLPRIDHGRHSNYYQVPTKDADATPQTVEDILWQNIRDNRQKQESEHAKAEHPGDVKKNLKESLIIKDSVRMERDRRLRPGHPLARLLTDAARLYKAIITSQDRQVLEPFLFAESPIHPRRSRDQAYFWKLRTTYRRDRDQVVYRYTKPKFHHKFQGPEKHKSKIKAMQNRFKVMEGWEWTRHGRYEDSRGCDECTDRIHQLARAVMVDQLWMWILDENTILTCFPKRYGVGKKDPSGVHHSMRNSLNDQSNSTSKRQRLRQAASDYEYVCGVDWQSSFHHLSQLAEMKIHEAATKDGVTAESLLALVSINKESHMQREIRDIIDELDIMIYVVTQQEQVITKFTEQAKEILGRGEQLSETVKRTQYTTFEKRAKEIICEVEFQIKNWRVGDLIALKQQQASIVQAYHAMKQGEETMRQGKAIMLFTVMMMVCLPLSFTSSLFGINAIELSGSGGGDGDDPDPPPVPSQIVNLWPTTFVRQIMIIFSVSAVAVAFVIIPAFSPLMRTLIWAHLRLALAVFGVHLQLYRLWLWYWGGNVVAHPGLRHPSVKISRRVDSKIEMMKEDVRKGRRARTLREAAEKDPPPRAAEDTEASRQGTPVIGGGNDSIV
ncbi:hypothetical protein B0H66DRAFT_586382 [Apodospora peruviana]|uniref:Uncharacterized protein n=1 Tax=Apodospora peruviana TaxID=516989 RepID=A0AAE0IRZ8_9PEZI|nr:hypothetical protein B0H66DRAFT_586382 [Apodospora peruviana]